MSEPVINASRGPVRLAVVSSHPIQYNAPLFAALARREGVESRVFYSWHGTSDKPDPEFGHVITWDLPLLEGYDHEFVRNVSPDRGSHRFLGLINPAMVERIEAFRPEAVLVFGWPFWTHMRVLRHFHGRIPVLFRGDSTLSHSGGRVRAFLRNRVLSEVYRHVDLA